MAFELVVVVIVVVQENSFACVSFKVIVKDQSYWFQTISIKVTFISRKIITLLDFDTVHLIVQLIFT